MDFYYCPILGLQMTFGFKVYEVDLSSVQMHVSDWVNILNQTGVMFLDSAENENSVMEIPRITSNMK